MYLGISSIKLAKYLTREVMYRGFRRSPGSFPGSWGGITRKEVKKGRVKVSALSSNVLGAFFYSLISIFSSLSLIMMPKGTASPAEVFAIALTILLSFGIAMILMQVAPFTSVFIREGILDLIRTLPLSDSEILKAYLASATLYSGGLSVSFMFIPFLITASYLSIHGGLPPPYVGVGALSAACLIVFGFSIGMAIGSYSYSLSRRASLRAVSTVAWLACFAMTYLMYGMMSWIVKAALYVAPALSTWGLMVPFIGPLYAWGRPALLAACIAETVTISALSYTLALRRVRALMLGAEYAVAAKASIKVSAPSIRVTGVIHGMIRKDLKLLSRDPRRFANMLFLTILPLIFSFTMSGRKLGVLGMPLSLMVAGFAGSMSGISSDVLYYIEGGGAAVLYTLPLSRRSVALSKSLCASMITMPIAVAVSSIIPVLSGGSPYLVAASGLIAASLNLGYSLLNSSITIKLLPKEPSEWTEYSLSMLGKRFIKGLMRVLFAIAGAGLPVLLMILSLSGIIRYGLIEVIMYAFAASVLAAGVAALLSIKSCEDLTT